MQKHPPMRSRYHRLSVMGMLLLNLWLVGWLSACGGPVNPDYCSIAPPNRDPHFAMTGGLLYLKADYSNSLYAVRASDGVRQWQYNASGRVSVFDDRVYYSSTDLYALRASDGKPLWHTSQSMGLIGVTPSMVFARSADTLYALNASTGSQLWQQKIDLNYPPVSIQVVNDLVYVVSDYARVSALRASDGSQVWQYNTGSLPGTPLENSLLMSIDHGIVYLKSDQIYALRASDGTLLWRFPKTGEQMEVSDGLVYVVSDHLASGAFVSDAIYVLRASDGKQLWQWQVPTQNQQYQLVLGTGVVYVGPRGTARYANTYQDHIYALKSNDGTPLWDTQVSSQGISLAVSDPMLYLLSNNALEARRVSDGTLLWHTSLQETGLLVANGVVYAGTAGNTNGCFPTTSSKIDALRVGDGSHVWSFSDNGVSSPSLP